MTNQQHSITPPPGLMASLRNSAPHGIRDAGVTRELWLINHAYAAGADQELEACCEWLRKNGLFETRIGHLRAARRPKPPSLKEQALAALSEADQGLNKFEWQQRSNTIRRALEQLDD
jgi:hypothetical protein